MKDNEFDYFLTVVKEQNLSRAAEKLFISQPYLTQYINKLEDNLGIKLFNRNKSPITLTPAGKVYLKYAEESIENWKILFKKFDDIKNEESGSISFAIHYQLGSKILPKVLPEFNRKYPKIHIKFYEERSTNELMSYLNGNKIDFAIIYMSSVSYVKYYELLMEQEIVMICSKEHRLCKLYPVNSYSPYEIDLEEIKNERIIMLNPAQAIYKVISDMFNEYGIRPDCVANSGNINTIIGLVANNFGISFVPQMYLQNNIEIEKIASFRIKNYPLKWPLFIVYNNSNIITKPMKLFVNTFKDCFNIEKSRMNDL